LSIVVLDASIALAMIRDEESAPVLRQELGTWIRRGDRLVVPAHFWLEIVNALGTRHRARGASIVEAIHHLDAFGLETIDLDRPHLLLVVDGMERHGLSAYDATYLIVAESIGASLATLDRRLASVAGERAVRFGETRAVHDASPSYGRAPTWPDYSGTSAFLAKLRADSFRERVTERS